MFHHDLRHTGLSPYDTSTNNGSLKWKLVTGGSTDSSPAISADGTIYLGTIGYTPNHNVGYPTGLAAVSADGTRKWTFATADEVSSSPAIGADGTIYFGSDDGNLYAVNPNVTTTCTLPRGQHYACPTQKWAFATGARVFSSPAIGADGTIYVGSTNGNLYAVNPNVTTTCSLPEGQHYICPTQKWAFATDGALFSSPAIGTDGTIYIGSEDHNLYAVNPDGRQKWKFATGDSVWSSPTIGTDGTIYFGSNDESLYAVNPDGRKKWAFSTGDRIGFSSPAIGTDGTIYVGSGDNGNLCMVGKAGWCSTIGDAMLGSPVIGADGTVYVGSLDGNLYAVNSDGMKKWAFPTGGDVDSSPAIGADGTIYVGSEEGHLYAIH